MINISDWDNCPSRVAALSSRRPGGWSRSSWHAGVGHRPVELITVVVTCAAGRGWWCRFERHRSRWWLPVALVGAVGDVGPGGTGDGGGYRCHRLVQRVVSVRVALVSVVVTGAAGRCCG